MNTLSDLTPQSQQVVRSITARRGRRRVWTCIDHDVINPVGGASVVVAHSEDEARELLDAALKAGGLKVDKYRYTLTPLDLTTSQAIVLRNGDY